MDCWPFVPTCVNYCWWCQFGCAPALMEAFHNFRGQCFKSKGRIHRFQTDLPLSRDAWLIVSGGLMLIFGLLVLLRLMPWPLL